MPRPPHVDPSDALKAADDDGVDREHADDPFARGVAAGRRAALRDVTLALASLMGRGDEDDATPQRARAKFAPGVDPQRLRRFMEATSHRSPQQSAPVPPLRLGEELGTPPPAITAPLTSERPPIGAPRPNRDGARSAAEYVRARARRWWDKAKDERLDPAVRAEARAIGAELFEIGEALSGDTRAPKEPASERDDADED